MKKIDSITLNEKEGLVTVVTKYPKIEEVTTQLSNGKEKVVGFELKEAKSVEIIKCSEGDEFDPYVGAALGIVYQMFGSRTQFRKFVDKVGKVISNKKEGK